MSQTTHTDDPGFSTKGAYVTGGEEFTRDTNYIEDRITRDGAPGSNGEPGWPVEPGRYRLIAARACPWANRTVIVRRLLGLEDVISLGLPGPTHDAAVLDLRPRPGRRGPGARHRAHPGRLLPPLPRLPPRASPSRRSSTSPAGRSSPTTSRRSRSTSPPSGPQYHRAGAPELYPEHLRDEIDEVNKRVFTEVNNGVYRCGFAGSQEAYDAAYDRLWTALDWLEERLAGQRYLVGDTITEADVRLFTTLARFDAVYHGHFKCNRQKLSEMPVAVGLRARPVPDPRVRRHHRLRADQAALLHRPRGHQPHRNRPARAGPGQLAHRARPGSAGRPAVRRRHAAGTGPGRRRGAPPGHGAAGWEACEDAAAAAGSSSCRSNLPALG